MSPVTGSGTNNCMRICVASLLNVPYDAVPDLRGEDHGQQDRLVEDFLLTRRLLIRWESHRQSEIAWQGFHLMCGFVMDESTKCGHATVALKGSVVYDPAGFKFGALMPWTDQDEYLCGYLFYRPTVPKYAADYDPKPFLSLK
jgi:hypothetical protein